VGADLSRSAHGTTRLGREVAIDEQHAARPDGREVEVANPSLEGAPIGDQEAPLAAAPLYEDHRDACGPLGIEAQTARAHARIAELSAHEAPVGVVTHQGEHVALAAEMRSRGQRGADHAAARNEAVGVADALRVGVQTLDHVEVIHDAQPQTYDSPGFAARHGACVLPDPAGIRYADDGPGLHRGLPPSLLPPNAPEWTRAPEVGDRVRVS